MNVNSDAGRHVHAATAALVLVAQAAVLAHDPGLSLLDVDLVPGRLVVTLTIAAADAAIVEGRHGDLAALAIEDIDVSIDGAPLDGAVRHVSIDGESNRLLAIHFDRPRGSRLTIHSSVPARFPFGHREMLVVRVDGQPLAERMLDARQPEFSLDLDAARVADGGGFASFARPSREIRLASMLLMVAATGWLIRRRLRAGCGSSA